MGMSGMYGEADRREALATIDAALAGGVTLLDTGDFYGMGHNELLVGEALRDRPREDVVVSVKFGAQRDPSGAWIGYDARPAAVKTALAYTLTRLGIDYVDVYRPARLDSEVPIEETVGAIGELIDAGYVRQVGLSEVGAQTIRRAHAVRPVADLQIEYSLVSRGVEQEILPTCRELGIAITAYGVLSRGLLSGHWTADRQLDPSDFRARAPRFQGENLKRNLALVDQLRQLAEQRDATTAQLAVAWVASRGDDVVPLIGARRRDQLQEALGAIDIELTTEDVAALELAASPDAVAGDRYPQAQMAHLDSER
jgi:aryl-alcohol dehydrogenase-like predicted oxidoreductase